MKYLQSFKKQFDNTLLNYLQTKEKEFFSIDPQAQILITILKEFVTRGGKRFRPALFYCTYQSFASQKMTDILDLSVTFELFHTFGLIHDDIIDNSDLRRGKPTMHNMYGREKAILVGDLSLILADELFYQKIVQLQLSKLKKIQLIELYSLYKKEVIVGQYLDLIKANIQKIMELKTANYSFVHPVQMAMILANSDNKTTADIVDIVKKMGVVFQIKDDLIGIFGTKDKIGKPIDSDLREGKNTYVIKLFLGKATPIQKKRFYSFFRLSQLTEDDYLWFKSIARKNGILDELKSYIEQEAQTLQKQLQGMVPANIILKDFLLELLKKIQDMTDLDD